MKRVTVHKVSVNQDSWVSAGIGFDDDGVPVEFIGHTKTMSNIGEALEDFEDDNSLGRPAIYLESWQWQNLDKVVYE